MDSGLYAAYAGLLARNESLDAAASNLANASTPGFRAEREFFREAIAGGAESARSQLGKATNAFSVLGGSILDLGQGQLAPTGNTLDLALQGPGFFALQTPAGVRYTRNGSFRQTPTGSIETAAGEPVLNTAGQPIVAPPGELAVGSDGSVSVDGAIVGRLGLYDLPERSISAEGVGRYKLLGTAPAKASTATTVRQGYLEAANENSVDGSLQLVVLQRQAEMMQKAFGVFTGTFDKIASEDLPKIGG